MNSKQVVQGLLERAQVHINGSHPWDILVHNDRFYDRVLAEGSLGLGESYMEGWWDANQLDEFFFRFHSMGLDKAVRDKPF
jgi:cyclopropane-fatty-acyl-phospholipid synthase